MRSDSFYLKLVKHKYIKPVVSGSGESGISMFSLMNQVRVASGEAPDLSASIEGEEDIDTKEAVEGKDLIKITLDALDRYYKVMTRIISSNPAVIDLSGTFKRNDMVKTFINPAMDVLSYAYEDEANPVMESINKLVTLIANPKTAKKLKGTSTSPFFYEGLQLLLFEGLYHLVNMVPVALSNGVSMKDISSVTNTAVLEGYIAMITDIASPEYYDALSNVVSFEETPVKANGGESGFLDFSGIADTPLAAYTEFDKYAGGESIVNALNFKKSGKLDIILSVINALTLTAEMLSDKSLRPRYDVARAIDNMIKDNNPDTRERALNDIKEKYRSNLLDDLQRRKKLQENEEVSAVKAMF